MPLSAGDKLGHFDVISLLGNGGMGEVWKARDTTLKREVALKVLPPQFLRDPDRMARFHREAEVLASLDHPNIGHIHGIVDSADSRALVLALIEGPTLADRIQAGPIPLNEAVAIAKQIIEALEYAHDRGVVHRDLKPANVKITPDGVVKVLDFGLAKVLEDEPAASSLADSPTLTLGHTRAGVILGTAAYMSPEQAVGRPVDRRSDVFSFGAVLYEMLTSKRAFSGATTPDVIEAVVKNDPDWSKLPAGTPRAIHQLLLRCLAKDRKRRLQAIGEARIALEDWASGAEVPGPEDAAAATRATSMLPWAAAALATLVAVLLGYVAYHYWSEEPQVLKMTLQPPDSAYFNGPAYIPMISPDGRHVVFAAYVDGRDLWIRDLDALSARRLPGTAKASYPFWSPDSRWVAFSADGKLKKIDLNGGPAVTVCVCQERLGTWNQEDVIVFGSGPTLFRVPAAGGTPVELSHRASEGARLAPRFLPDGRHFLYMGRNTDAQQTRIYVDTIDSKPGSNSRREVLTANSNVVYVPPTHAKRMGASLFGGNEGYILFLRDRTLMAQPFDAGNTQTTGDAVPIAERVDDWQFGSDRQGQFSASENGILVYTSGAAAGGKVQLTWFDRSGKPGGVVGNPGVIRGVAISPDGATVAADRLDASALRDIWLYDLARGTASQFTFGPANNQFPVWSPDGNKIIFHSLRDGGKPYQKASSGVGQEEVLDYDSRNNTVVSLSPDGRYLIEEVITDPKTGRDIWVIPTFGDKTPFPYLNTEFYESAAKLSPNGQFLAYVSNESKRYEVYVQTFPEHGGKWQVSTGYGNYPVWSRDGRELYFIGAIGEHLKMMAVAVSGSGKKFEPGVPKPLFDVPAVSEFDVSKDGRFLIKVPQDDAAVNVPITVLVNWQAALKK